MRFGPKCKRGTLPVYSVADEEEARMLLTLSCPSNGGVKDEWVAPELLKEQTLENLDKFSERLDQWHTRMKEKGNCRCK